MDLFTPLRRLFKGLEAATAPVAPPIEMFSELFLPIELDGEDTPTL